MRVSVPDLIFIASILSSAKTFIEGASFATTDVDPSASAPVSDTHKTVLVDRRLRASEDMDTEEKIGLEAKSFLDTLATLFNMFNYFSRRLSLYLPLYVTADITHDVRVDEGLIGHIYLPEKWVGTNKQAYKRL